MVDGCWYCTMRQAQEALCNPRVMRSKNRNKRRDLSYRFQRYYLIDDWIQTTITMPPKLQLSSSATYRLPDVNPDPEANIEQAVVGFDPCHLSSQSLGPGCKLVPGAVP